MADRAGQTAIRYLERVVLYETRAVVIREQTSESHSGQGIAQNVGAHPCRGQVLSGTHGASDFRHELVAPRRGRAPCDRTHESPVRTWPRVPFGLHQNERRESRPPSTTPRGHTPLPPRRPLSPHAPPTPLPHP